MIRKIQKKKTPILRMPGLMICWLRSRDTRVLRSRSLRSRVRLSQRRSSMPGKMVVRNKKGIAASKSGRKSVRR